MMSETPDAPHGGPRPHPTRIAVFQQGASGNLKIEGIKEFGRGVRIVRTIAIDLSLPPIIDEPEAYIDSDFDADLVLSFLKHPDLIDHLARLCREKGIPLVASGTKAPGAITPFTCCGLGHRHDLGAYGEQFGLPELEVEVLDNRISRVRVKRGASCGATWKAADRIIGLAPEAALPTLAREVQYLCVADPSAFDPISGKSALHYAGEVHAAALKKALAHQKK